MDFNDVALESCTEDHCKIFELNEVTRSLNEIQSRIAVEGMSRDDAQVLNQMIPGIFDDQGIKKFTALPSRTGQDLALEAIDWKKAGLVTAAAAAIIMLIGKMLNWMNDSLISGGSSAGGIKDVEKVNKKIEENIKDVEAETLVPEKDLGKISKDVLRTVRRYNDSVETRYINQLIKRVERGDLKDIRPEDVVAAVSMYTSVTKRMGLRDADKAQHALLGHMLTQRDGGISAGLSMLGWSGSIGSDLITTNHIGAIGSLLTYVTSILSEANLLANAIDKGDERDFILAKHGKPGNNYTLLNGESGKGATMYNAMSEAIKRTADTINLINRDAMTNQVVCTNTKQGVDAVSTIGLLDSGIQLRVPVKRTFDMFSDRCNVYACMWTKSPFHKYENREAALSYVPMLKALADPNGRKELEKIYKSVYKVERDEATPVFGGQIDAAQSALSDLSKKVNELSKRSQSDREKWMSTPFWAPTGNTVHNVEQNAKYDQGQALVPIDSLKLVIGTAEDIMGVVTKLNSVALRVSKLANHAVNQASRIGK